MAMAPRFNRGLSVVDIFIWLSSKIANFYHTESCRTKIGVEFHQKSIGAIMCSATPYNDWQRCAASMKLTGTDRQAGGQTGKAIYP